MPLNKRCGHDVGRNKKIIELARDISVGSPISCLLDEINPSLCHSITGKKLYELLKKN